MENLIEKYKTDISKKRENEKSNEKLKKSKNEVNELKFLDTLLKEEKEKIKQIQGRDVGNKIINYFYFSAPETKRIEKEKEKILSSKEKIELIIEEMNNNYKKLS